MSTKIKVLKAHHGDCIIVETLDNYGNPFVLLIDGGPPQTFKTVLRKELEGYSKIDLVILTHIDDDHVGGLLNFLKSDLTTNIKIERIIVNSPNLIKFNTGTQISYQDGFDFEKKVFEKYPNAKIYSGIALGDNNFQLPNGISIKILSPSNSILGELYKNWPHITFKKEDNTQISSAILDKAKDYDISLDDLAKAKDDRKSIKSDIFNASSIRLDVNW